MTHFPGAVQILDYYHAAGHLAEFCDLLPASMRDGHLRQWSTLLSNGEPLQLIVEMKRSVANLTDAAGGWKHLNNFQNNQQRMDYGRYRACGWPIGSGSVEGQCKFGRGPALQGQRDALEAARQRMRAAHPPRRPQR